MLKFIYAFVSSQALICFENKITSSKDLASINEVISCSFAKIISKLFLTNSKKFGLCLSTQNKSDNDIAVFFEFWRVWGRFWTDFGPNWRHKWTPREAQNGAQHEQKSNTKLMINY